MTSDEKKTAAIAAALGVAAILVIWMLRGKTTYSQLPASTTSVPATQVAGTIANPPGYTSYNIPGFDPGKLPGIVSNNAAVSNINLGKGCCPGCAGSDDTTTSVGEYLALSGLGNYAGAA